MLLCLRHRQVITIVVCVEMFFPFYGKRNYARSQYRNIANSQSYKNSIQSPPSRVILYNASERTQYDDSNRAQILLVMRAARIV